MLNRYGYVSWTVLHELYLFITPLQLSYAAGTLVPLMLTVKGLDAHAVDLLGSPNSPRVTLRRKYTAPFDQSFDDVLMSLPGTEDSIPISTARWMVTSTNAEKSDYKSFVRTLYGELLLPSHLTPSFTFGPFNLKASSFLNAQALYLTFPTVLCRFLSLLCYRLCREQSGSNFTDGGHDNFSPFRWPSATLLHPP